MRILVSTPTFLPVVGGAELGIHEIYKRLGQKHDVTILTVRPGSRGMADYAADDYATDKYRVRHALAEVEQRAPILLARAAKRTSLPLLAELIVLNRMRPIDVLNVHYVDRHGPVAIYARRALGIPVVTSLVGRSDVIRLLSLQKRIYAQSVSAVTDTTVVNSTFYLRGARFGKRVEVIPYGVDVESFRPRAEMQELRHELGIGPTDVVLLAVQRLAALKRVDILLQVLARLRRRRQRVVLIVAGKGREDARLKGLANALGVGKQVRFLGYVPSGRLPDLFAAADVFVTHSMFETFGIMFAQAMASGLPIVAARTSSIPDVLGTENAIVVRPFDVEGFALAIEELAANQELRRQMGTANRARALAEFNWDRIAEAYEETLRRVAERGPV